MPPSLKTLTKSALLAVAPKHTTALLSARARAHSHRVVAQWGCVEINRRIAARFGSAVQEGPFRGTILTPTTHAEHLGPFLLGVYESELGPAWDVILGGTYPQIVDVGAKFGYYAVGLARLFPTAQVVAFDTDPWARAATREMVAANGTTNVAVRGFCDPRWMRTALLPGAFVFSDCEGFEGPLFTSEPIPHLASATLIVETHDELNPGVTERLRSRLSPTHAIRIFTGDSPRRESTRDLAFLSADERRLATHEVRGPQAWLFCTPKAERTAAADTSPKNV